MFPEIQQYVIVLLWCLFLKLTPLKARSSLLRTELLQRLSSLVTSSPSDDMLVPMDAIALVDGTLLTYIFFVHHCLTFVTPEEKKKAQDSQQEQWCKVEQAIVEILGNMAINDEAKFEIKRVGLIPLLVSLLRRAQHPGQNVVGSLAARAIATLAFNGLFSLLFLLNLQELTLLCRK